MEKKETTASEVSQMEERQRGGWMERGGEREGGDRSQLKLANLPLLLSALTVRTDNRSWKLWLSNLVFGLFFSLLVQFVASAAHPSVYLLLNLSV